MNYRVTLALLVVLAALGGVLIFSDQSKKSEPGPAKESDQQVELFGVEPADVQRLEVRRGRDSRLFQKADEGKWTLQPTGEEADSTWVNGLASQLGTLYSTRRIPAAEADPGAYGLSSPRMAVQLGLQDGTTRELRIGEQTPVQTGYYAQTTAGGDVYVVAGTVVAILERLVDQPLAPTPTPAPTSRPTTTPTPAATAPPVSSRTPTLPPTATPPPTPVR